MGLPNRGDIIITKAYSADTPTPYCVRFHEGQQQYIAPSYEAARRSADDFAHANKRDVWSTDDDHVFSCISRFRFG